MLVVETVARVRRAYFVQEKSIKEIVRDLKVAQDRPEGDPVGSNLVPLRPRDAACSEAWALA
jgi:hypothetical protein